MNGSPPDHLAAYISRLSSAAYTGYLDYNATAPLRPEARDAMVEALGRTGNPSSVHRQGRAARHALEAARAELAAVIGVEPAGVIFTSGGTEANDLALGVIEGPVLVSAIEHDSILASLPDATRIPATPSGQVDLDVLERLMAEVRPRLVSVMAANNETGVLQPLAEVAKLARRHGALVHADAVQAAGKIALDAPALGLDLVSLSAHKLGGPPGVGALLAAPGIEVRPRLRGGAQEARRRAGTENLPGVLGFAAAVRASRADTGWRARVGTLRDRLEGELGGLVAPDALPIFGAASERLANTSCLAMPGVGAETQVIALDLEGIAVSSGAACSSGKVGPSHVLAAMGMAPELAACAIRVSLGWASEPVEVDRFVAAWTRLYQRTRGRRT